MHTRLFSELSEFPTLLATATRYAVDALAGLQDRRVTERPAPPPPRALSCEGTGFGPALDDFNARWAPGFAATAGPRYLGFVTGGATPAALAGDWLTSTFDQNPNSSLDSTAQALEQETLGWLRTLFGLSEAQHGSFVTGATMSNMVGLAIGREWAGERKNVRVSEEGMAALGNLKVLSGAPHSSIFKALSMLGVGRQAVRRLALMPGREAIDLSALEQALQENSDNPVIVVVNCGTVNTVDFDDLDAIVALKQRHAFWLHVDAAFGGFAALSKEHAHLVTSLDAADSICIDCHKWLNVPYDSAVQFTRRRDLQMRVFQNNAAYLGLPLENPDFVHLTPENSRRLRALPAWFALAAYGRDGHRDIVERNIACARRLGDLIEMESRLTLLAPVNMNVVCFTLADRDRDRPGDPMQQREVQAMIERLRDGGEVFLTPTVLNGTWAIRAAFSNWRTTEQDVERVFAAIRAALPSSAGMP
jgi:glutamate/tyrosine decarboxylase-like PLP-dependent enzyme